MKTIYEHNPGRYVLVIIIFEVFWPMKMNLIEKLTDSIISIIIIALQTFNRYGDVILMVLGMINV